MWKRRPLWADPISSKDQKLISTALVCSLCLPSLQYYQAQALIPAHASVQQDFHSVKISVVVRYGFSFLDDDTNSFIDGTIDEQSLVQIPT